MDTASAEPWIKQRRLRLSAPATGRDGAMQDLEESVRRLDGVESASVSRDVIDLTYDLRHITLAQIVGRITATAVTMNGALTARIRLAIVYYREAIQREDLDHDAGWDSYVREIHVSRYRKRRHGRRDDRPQHWRQYLNRDDRNV